MLVGQDALRHHPGIMAVKRQLADGLAGEILRLPDAAGLVDVDRRMAERTVREYRNGNERRVHFHGAQEVGHSQLRHVVRALPDHLLEDFRNDERAVKMRIDTVDPDLAVRQRTGPVVIPEGDVELHVGRAVNSRSIGSII